MMRTPGHMYLQRSHIIVLFLYAQKTHTGMREFQPPIPTTGLFSFLAPGVCIACQSSQA